MDSEEIMYTIIWCVLFVAIGITSTKCQSEYTRQLIIEKTYELQKVNSDNKLTAESIDKAVKAVNAESEAKPGNSNGN